MNRDLARAVMLAQMSMTTQEIRVPAAELKRPPSHWTRVPIVKELAARGAEAYGYGGLMVTTELATMEAPDGSGEAIPTWLIAVSRRGSRPNDRDVDRARRAFGMEAAAEDNHSPGITRAFFLTVDPARQRECECKVSEQLITEPDGYQWSADRDPSKCGGCDWARSRGRKCPVHG